MSSRGTVSKSQHGLDFAFHLADNAMDRCLGLGFINAIIDLGVDGFGEA